MQSCLIGDKISLANRLCKSRTSCVYHTVHRLGIKGELKVVLVLCCVVLCIWGELQMYANKRSISLDAFSEQI